MKRWLILTFAVAALAVGAWAVLTTPGPASDAGRDGIGAESRAELQRVLREEGGP